MTPFAAMTLLVALTIHPRSKVELPVGGGLRGLAGVKWCSKGSPASPGGALAVLRSDELGSASERATGWGGGQLLGNVGTFGQAVLPHVIG